MAEQAMDRGELMARWAALRASSKRIKGAAATLDRVVGRFSDSGGYDALKVAERELAKLDGLSIDAEELLARVGALAGETRAWVETEWVRRSHHVVEDLRREFRERGVHLAQLDETSGSALVFHAFPVAIRLVPSEDRAELLHAGEVIRPRVPLSAPRLFTAWDKARGMLEKSGTEPDDFARELREAYANLRKLGQLRASGRARLADLNFQVFVQRQTARGGRTDPRRRRIVEYPRWNFAWDLGRLLDYMVESPDAFADLDFHRASRTAAAGRSTSVLVERESGAMESYADLTVKGG